MKVDGSLKSLIQGVSQQPPRSRLPGQCTLQENMSSNPVDGLTRRPPIDFIADLFTDSAEPQFYDLDFGAEDKYVLAATPGKLRVFDLDGDEHTVTDALIDTSTSTTSVAIGTGSKSFTTQTAKSYVVGQWILIQRTADTTKTMYGTCTSYNSGTGALVVDVSEIGGTGTFTDWTITSRNLSYVDGSNLAFTTIDNKVYIANTNKVVRMKADVKSFRDYNSFYFVLGGQYSRTYTVTVNWRETTPTGTARSRTFTFATPDGSDPAHMFEIGSANIAAKILDAMVAEATFSFNSVFAFSRIDETVYIRWAGARTDKFEVIAHDTDGSASIFACNNLVTDISKLPRIAVQGYHVTVQGDVTSDADNYYLQFVIPADSAGSSPAVGNGFGSNGTWVETVKSQTPYLLDQNTMPHVLTYDYAAETFSFAVGNWEGRQVGDTISNEDPSFVGTTINDLSYFQSRLVVLAGPATIMSRTNTPTDFWIKSATVSNDSDSIDIESTAKGVTQMLKAIPHNRDLVVYADAGQFIVFGRNQLTPSNASLVLTTAFEAELAAKPVSAGRNVFFAINYGRYTGIREFFTDGAQDINDSRPITQHVLKYIPGRVEHLASTSNFSLLLVKAGTEDVLYPYEYIWQDDKKVQASWSSWKLPYPVAYFFFRESVIYLIAKIGNNYTLESLDMDTQDDEGIPYQAKLDRKIYIDDTDDTIVNLYTDMPDDIEDLVIVQGEGCPHPGLRVLIEDYDEGTNTITLRQDMDGGTVICGLRYLSRYKPTMPFAKDEDGVKIGTGNLIVSKFLANTKESADFNTKVTSPYKEDQTMHFSGYVVGNPNTVVGEAPISDLTQTIPFRENTDNGDLEFYTSSHLPFGLSDIEWLGQYTKRGKRIVQGG